MGIFVGFCPFIVFALLSSFVAPSVSLWAAAALSAALILREKMRGGATKLLEASTFVFFTLLGFYASIRPDGWDIPIFRSLVDGGLLLIMLLSLIIRGPFTLQYVREQVPPVVQSSPTFIRANYVISIAWALAMTIIVIADLLMHFEPALPLEVDVAGIVVALGGAFWFTKWYPKRNQTAYRVMQEMLKRF